eukprot:3732604-Alexandrium_andersonii.AAC.1
MRELPDELMAMREDRYSVLNPAVQDVEDARDAEDVLEVQEAFAGVVMVIWVRGVSLTIFGVRAWLALN